MCSSEAVYIYDLPETLMCLVVRIAKRHKRVADGINETQGKAARTLLVELCE